MLPLASMVAVFLGQLVRILFSSFSHVLEKVEFTSNMHLQLHFSM